MEGQDQSPRVRATILSNLAWKRLQRGSVIPSQYEEEKNEVELNEDEIEIEKPRNLSKFQSSPRTEEIEEEKVINNKPKKKETKKSSVNKKKSQARIRACMWIMLGFKFMCEDRKKNAYEKKDTIEEKVTMKISPTYEVR